MIKHQLVDNIPGSCRVYLVSKTCVLVGLGPHHDLDTARGCDKGKEGAYKTEICSCILMGI